MKNSTTFSQRPTGFSEYSRGSGQLVELRDKLNLSQTELAAKIGISHAAIRYNERKGTLPRGKAVLDNLRALGASVGVEIE